MTAPTDRAPFTVDELLAKIREVAEDPVHRVRWVDVPSYRRGWEQACVTLRWWVEDQAEVDA